MKLTSLLLSISTLAVARPWEQDQLAFQLPVGAQALAAQGAAGFSGLADRVAAHFDGTHRLKHAVDDAWGVVRGVVHEGGKRCGSPFARPHEKEVAKRGGAEG